MISTGDLLSRWCEGDAKAGDAIVQRFLPSVTRFFRTKLGDDVEDLIQQTFMEALRDAANLRDPAMFRGFLFAIARNRLYDHLRRTSVERDNVEAASVRDLGTSPSQAVARSEEQALVRRALDEISLEHRIALELAYWEGLSGEEIARALEVPPNTARGRLAKARAALRRRVELLASSAEVGRRTAERLDALTRTSADS